MTELNNLTGFRSEVFWISRSLRKHQRDLEVLKSQAYWANKELEKVLSFSNNIKPYAFAPASFRLQIRDTLDAIAKKRVEQCHPPEPSASTRCPNAPSR